MSTELNLGHVKILLHNKGAGAMSYEEKGTWVYLVTSADAYVVYLAIMLGRPENSVSAYPVRVESGKVWVAA